MEIVDLRQNRHLAFPKIRDKVVSIDTAIKPFNYEFNCYFFFAN